MAHQKTFDSVKAHIEEVRLSGIAPPGQLAYITSCLILRSFLGLEWLERHVMGNTAPTDFFCNDCANEARSNAHKLRVIHLAEMLVNLKEVPNFGSVLKGLQEGPKVEPSFAELEAGKILAIFKVPFRFVVPSGVAGSDYDIQIKMGHEYVCADVKCRLETTAECEDTLFGVLNRAVTKQLPRDKPGAFFIRVPQSWNVDGRQDRHLEIFHRIANRLYGQTQRVVSVVFYFSLALDFDGNTAPIMLLKAT